MRTILQLLRLPFLTPYSLLLLFRAKRKHGNNLCFLLKFASDYYGTATAIADENTRLNFNQLYEKVLRLSLVIWQRMNDQAIGTVVLVCNNSINHILAFYATHNLGLKLVLINNKLFPAEIHKIINKQSSPCFVLGSDLTIENAIDIDELVAASNERQKGEYFSKEQARVIFPTSGTTGDVKLIEKKSGAFYWLRSFVDLIQRTGIDKNNAVYIAVPVSHGFGYTALLFTLILGKKSVVSCTGNSTALTGFLLKEKVDSLVGVPTTLYKVAEQLKPAQHAVNIIISGGAPMNETIFSKLSSLTNSVFSMYGSTEASTSFIADHAQLSMDPSALGTPLKGVKYKLLTLPGGEKELLIQSPLANAGSGSDWLATGDLVEEHSNGVLVWLSRKDDMIIKMGVNIYPIEIETALRKIACIEDVCVVGKKDTMKGEIVVAFIKIKAGASFDEKMVIETLRQSLSGIKIPDKFTEVDYFDYTGTGKLIRRKTGMSNEVDMQKEN